MINSDDVAKENIKVDNTNWSKIPDHPYRILSFGGSASGKTNSLFNVISHQPDIDKIYLYAKDPFETNHQLLIKKRESTGLNHLNDSRAWIFEYSNDMDDIYKIFKGYNPNEKCKILIVFDDMIADMLSDKNHNPVVNELFVRGIKLITSLAFITQSYFAVSQNITLNIFHCFIKKVPEKWELQQIAFSQSLDIEF